MSALALSSGWGSATTSSTQILPYLRTASRYMPAVVRRAVPVARWAYKRRRTGLNTYRAVKQTADWLARAERASSKISRAYRRYKSKKAARRNIGERVSSSTARPIDTQSISPNNLVERQLYVQRINWPVQGSGRDQRERFVINLRGIKFCQDFAATSGFTTINASTVYLNVAVVTNKHDPQADGINNNRWFRSYTNARGTDFNNLNSGIDLHCRPINTDEWNVLAHTRTQLHSLDAPSGNTTYRFMKYIPIKRQVRFDQDGIASHNIFIVWWLALPGEQGLPNATQIVKTTWHHVLYFRNHKD